MNKIILASKSPRRALLLQWAEVPFEVITQDTNEDYPEGLNAVEVAKFISRNKAVAVREYLLTQEREETGIMDPVLAADTIVVLDKHIIGKPSSPEEAQNTLRKLSGRKHQVITGVCILDGQKEIIFSEITEVVFHPLSDQQIRYYVDQYKPYDKAGAYAIQEWIGVVGIESIRGDFYNVMGLPVSRVLMEIARLK